MTSSLATREAVWGSGYFKTDGKNDRRIFRSHPGKRQGLGDGLDLGAFFHCFDEFGCRHQRSLVGNELKLVGDCNQVLAGHCTLFNDLDTFLCALVTVGRTSSVGISTRLHQDFTFRKEGRWPECRNRKAHQQYRNKRDDEKEPSSLHQFPVEGRPQQIASVALLLLEFGSGQSANKGLSSAADN